VNGIQILLIGGAIVLLLIAFAQPADRPLPNFVWGLMGAGLIMLAILPVALLLVILGLAFFVMFRGLRRY
jgi:hypothetical protein